MLSKTNNKKKTTANNKEEKKIRLKEEFIER